MKCLGVVRYDLTKNYNFNVKSSLHSLLSQPSIEKLHHELTNGTKKENILYIKLKFGIQPTTTTVLIDSLSDDRLSCRRIATPFLYACYKFYEWMKYQMNEKRMMV